MRTLTCLFFLTALSLAGDIDHVVDQLFHCDPKVRESARKQLLALRKNALADVLGRIEDREANKPSKDAALQVYSIRDLRHNKVYWRGALARLQKLGAVVHEQANDVLIVYAKEEVHAQVAKKLAELRQRLSRVVHVESSIVQLSMGTTAPRAFARGEFTTWIKKTGAKVTRLPALTCPSEQRVEVTATRTISYIADFRVEVGQGTCSAEPIEARLRRGVVLRIRWLATEDRKSVQLDIDVRSSEVKLPMPETERKVPIGRAFWSETTESGMTQVRTSRRVRGRASTVVDLGAGMDGIRRVLVVTPTPERLDAK